MTTIRVGVVGLGANARLRHVPGLRSCPGVEITAVCNRSQDSTAAVAREFGIAKTYDRWQDLVNDPQIDAVVIGTWPYLHCEISLAALAAGKHVLTEARMAMNALEAHRMLAAARQHPQLVTQIVPSPLGLKAHRVVLEMLADGFIGTLREVVVLGCSDAFADSETPLHWRQSAKYSGLNALTLGILHETLIRWIPDPVSVLAQTEVFTPVRDDLELNRRQEVGIPDCVHALTEIPGGARGLYHLSGAVHYGPGQQIHLYGSEGTLKYMLAPEDRLLGSRKGDQGLWEIPIPKDKAGEWRVEEEFVKAIRGEDRVLMTDFETGVRYMEFVEAVMRSANSGRAVALPLRRGPNAASQDA